VKKTPLLFFMLLVLSLVLEVAACYLLWAGYPLYSAPAVPMTVGFHLLAALTAAAAVWSYDPLTRKCALFIFIFILTTPMLGYITIVQVLARADSHVTSALFAEYTEHIKSGTYRASLAGQVHKKSLTYLKEGFEIEPLSSTMENADSKAKLSVIKSLGKIPGPDTVRALKGMLADSHMDVRYFAGEEIAKVSEFYSILISEARREIDLHPGNPALYCELASLHMKHSLSGLFDENSAGPELQSAKEALERSLQLNGMQFEARYLSGRLYMELHEYDRALEYLESARAIRENDVPLMVAVAECYWEKKELGKMEPCLEVIRTGIHEYRGEDKPALVEFLEGWKHQGDNGKVSS